MVELMGILWLLVGAVYLAEGLSELIPAGKGAAILLIFFIGLLLVAFYIGV